MRFVLPLAEFMLGLVLAPLLPAVINRTKAWFSGRTGPPLLQSYYEIAKLLRKGAVYSTTTGAVFRAGPSVALAATVAALALAPRGGAAAPWAFPGDLVLFAGFLGVARLALVLAALDTGSAFEGMGGSREVQFAALAEPALYLGLGALAAATHATSLGTIYEALGTATLGRLGPVLLLVGGAFLVVYLAENARVPVDDPNTHLELTMIHEVMVLDHSGPDLAFVHYGAALKLWTLGLLVVGLVPYRASGALLAGLVPIVALFLLAVLVGAIESGMARFRLARVPQLLAAAIAFAGLAVLLVVR